MGQSARFLDISIQIIGGKSVSFDLQGYVLIDFSYKTYEEKTNIFLKRLESYFMMCWMAIWKEKWRKLGKNIYTVKWIIPGAKSDKNGLTSAANILIEYKMIVMVEDTRAWKNPPLNCHSNHMFLYLYIVYQLTTSHIYQNYCVMNDVDEKYS